ncbi:MAG: O-antigen ligase family protein [Clostridiales bacterium]|nr:O-antigen ligase family protein [Clostridiales bacterium]
MSGKAAGNKVNNNASYKSKGKNRAASDSLHINKPNYGLYILFAVICVVPLFVRLVKYDTGLSSFPWFPDDGFYYDVYLYYKQRIFIILAGIMAIYIFAKIYSDRQLLKRSSIFIPLGIYALLTILSTVFSKYLSFCLTGSFELFESVFALLGYCLVAYYSYIILRTERDFRYIQYFLIALSLIFTVLGLMEFLGFDFLVSEIGEKLVIPAEYGNIALNSSFEKGRVNLTLYNPNYVSFMCSLLIPIIFIMTLFERKIIPLILSIISLIGLIVCLIGSKSITGVFGMVLASLLLLILLYRYLLKHWIITLIMLFVVIATIIISDRLSDHVVYNKIKTSIKLLTLKSEFALSDIETGDEMVSVTYKGNKLNVVYVTDSNSLEMKIFDESMVPVNSRFDVEKFAYIIEDSRFEGFIIGFEQLYGAFYIDIDGKKWRFIYDYEDKTYYYINRYDKYDKIVKAPSAIFTGYENIASGRGYIWSRTIPLLKKYFILGSGPDTFTIAFPQNDYLGLYNAGYSEQLLTKPHNMYLQIGVQTGVLSLLALIVFYIWYFISSVRIYIKRKINNIYSRFGLAVLVGSLSYMITGLSYDSSICVAPVFWAMMGVGIAANYKAKQLMSAEEKSAVENKANAK